MDYDALVARLVQEIYETVLEKLPSEALNKPEKKLLVASDVHLSSCHDLLENQVVSDQYQVHCALATNMNCDYSQYDTLVLFHVTNETLASVARGLSDTPFSRMISQAILAGKRIIIPKEEIQFFQYTNTAPPSYYRVFEAKLKLLTCSGVIVCDRADLENVILGKAISSEIPATKVEQPKSQPPTPPLTLSCGSKKLKKRLITELDVKTAASQKYNTLIVDKKTLITDLAKDCARDKKISIVLE